MLVSGFAQAMPYVPSEGKSVVETIKSDGLPSELSAMRRAVAAHPDDLAAVSRLAQTYITQARNTGDPRFLGYAQAALNPWWKLADAPIDILVLRATIKQSSHQFSAALDDLKLALKKDRHNPQVWLTIATIQQVTGKYADAKNSCLHLASLTLDIVVQTCLSQVASLTGDASGAISRLAAAYQVASTMRPPIPPALHVWVLTLLAEMSARHGNAMAAQSWYQRALAVEAPDSYLLGAYADFLLDQHRHAEVLTLLRDKTRVDALLLRYTIALQREKSPLAVGQTSVLEQRFDAAALREDTVHQREQARFELQVKNRPAIALVLAQKNWAVQKEVADLRLLLEAALANNSRTAALPALLWLKENRLEDGMIQALASRLGGPAS